MARLAVDFAALLVLIVTLADTANLGLLRSVYAFPYGDKAGHFVLFGILSLMTNLPPLRLRPETDSRGLVVTGGLAVALLVGLEEVSQLWLASRSFDWLDLAASYSGILASACVTARLGKPRQRSAAPRA